MTLAPPDLLQANRAIDLSSIDAVGFDLDHTLALYDDAAVNELAATAARRLLVERLEYPGWLLDGGPMEVPAAARTLAADLRHGAVVKLDAGRRVMRARLGGRWLDPNELAGRYSHPLSDDCDTVYAVRSPFELPVLWLLDQMETRLPPGAGRAARCEDVRRMLDVAHTNGGLKKILRDDLQRFVSAIDGAAAGLERWAASGKRLFVVTNSEPDFAPAVLDLALGTSWRRIFRLVVMGAHKPAFFRAPPEHGPPERIPDGETALLLEGGTAACVESLLGVRTHRILFVGDNARSDIRAAREHGWWTAQVVPELATDRAPQHDAWGPPLSDGGVPTWLARLTREHADIVCDHAGRLLELDPSAALAPAHGAGPRPETP